MAKTNICSQVLVSTQWVEDHLSTSSISIIEVNTDLESGYAQGHIPGALAWNLHTDLEHTVQRDIPSKSQLENLLSASGIDNSTSVILYGDGNNRSATWAFWILKYYRHGDVRLIDGGRQKWINERRPLSKNPPSVSPGLYRILAHDESIRATKQYILDNLQNPSLKLLDTRTYEEYIGPLAGSSNINQGGVYRTGHIPGAIHIPWDESASHTGEFKNTDFLKHLYESQNLHSNQEVVTYCRLGIRASYSWFILKYLLGYENVRNYDGSWTEWGNSISAPIEIGVA